MNWSCRTLLMIPSLSVTTTLGLLSIGLLSVVCMGTGCLLPGMSYPCNIDDDCPFFAPFCITDAGEGQCRDQSVLPDPATQRSTGFIPPPPPAAPPPPPQPSSGPLYECSPSALDERTIALDPIQGNTASSEDNFQGSCTGNGAPDLVYRYHTGPLISDITMRLMDLEDTDLGLYVRTGCTEIESELACQDAEFAGTEESITLKNVPADIELYVFVDGFVAPAQGAFRLAVHEEEAAFITEGGPCDPNWERDVCDPNVPNLQCLSIRGAFTCRQQYLLETGDLCFPEETGRVCNPFNQEECLWTNGENRCQRPFTLPTDSPCAPNDEARTCNADANEHCVSFGFGFYCQNPAPNACAYQRNALTSPSTAFQNGVTNAFSLTNDYFSGSCTGSETWEHLFRYIVSGNAVNARFTIENASSFHPLYLRSSCAIPSTEIACSQTPLQEGNTTSQLNANDLRSGDEVTLFVEDALHDDDSGFTVTVEESPITLLNTGEICVPGDLETICDRRRGDLCRTDGEVTRCQTLIPAGDTCFDAVELSGIAGQVDGSLVNASNNYDTSALGNCTDYGSSGPDLLYAVLIPTGATFNATLQTPQADAVLYMLNSCPPGPQACVAGVDNTLMGPENLAFQNTSLNQWFYLAVDTFGDAGTDFHLNWFLSGG